MTNFADMLHTRSHVLQQQPYWHTFAHTSYYATPKGGTNVRVGMAQYGVGTHFGIGCAMHADSKGVCKVYIVAIDATYSSIYRTHTLTHSLIHSFLLIRICDVVVAVVAVSSATLVAT